MTFNSRKWRYFWYDTEERWERLGLKAWINRNPKVVVTLSAVSFFLLIAVVIGQLIPDKPVSSQEPELAWFYDLNTNELFTEKRTKLPPVKAPSGPLSDGTPAGVRAYVFTQEDPNNIEPRIGFLEMFSPEGKENQKAYDPQKHTAKRWAQGRFFRRPNDKKWFPADSPEGQAIYCEFFTGTKYTQFHVSSTTK